MTAKKRQPPWTPEENAALIALYFEMLDKATAGKSYNKAALIRFARGGDNITNRSSWALGKRSKQSVEFKLMNATAAHQAINPDAETMHSHGYRAMPNMQAGLKEAMHKTLTARTGADEFNIMDGAA